MAQMETLTLFSGFDLCVIGSPLFSKYTCVQTMIKIYING